MSFACVNGSHECTGCMNCQFTIPEWVEDRLDAAKSANDKLVNLVAKISDKIEEMIGEIEDLQGQFQAEMDEIPEGYEDSEEYETLQRNADKLDAAWDAAQDLFASIDEIA